MKKTNENEILYRQHFSDQHRAEKQERAGAVQVLRGKVQAAFVVLNYKKNKMYGNRKEM